ncbi:hypothetical protein GGS21DRAFT_506437 [Xylaria nigripes]|nr:hypothetical protein GGS21DRAFT_506437 [Xylaria nigripes]
MSSTTYQSPYKSTPTSSQLDLFVRWIRLKKYRIEVTYGVYVFTPGEKAVFWTLFCLFFAAIWTALAVYTPRSLALLLRAATYPFSSSSSSSSSTAPSCCPSDLSSCSARAIGAETAMDMLSGTAQNSQIA